MQLREENIDYAGLRRGGWSRPRGVLRAQLPDPSKGGARGYPVATRVLMLANPQMATASLRTMQRYRANGVQPLRMNGNKPIPKIRGEELEMLVFYRFAYPSATADEISAFIYRNSPYTDHLLSRQDIYRAEKYLKLSTKQLSTTAMQAFAPHQLMRRRLFWSQPPPIGINDVPLEELIDIDEAGFGLGVCNRPQGKSLIGVRIRNPGLYGHFQKFTLILAVGSSGFVHAHFRPVAGTTAERFFVFISEVLQRLGGVNRRTLMYDNLSSHFSDQTQTALDNSIHRSVARPPYRPQDAPIEYFINQIEQELQHRMFQIHTENDFIAAVLDIVANLNGIRATFQKLGY